MNRRTHNIHERFLRHIWSKQYLSGDLETTDDKSLTVMTVGHMNYDGGPDFCNAKIKIGDVTYFGDVEIHRTVFEWIQHQHQEDPRYNKVILHVVLETNVDTPPTLVYSGRRIPVFVLGRFLSDSIQTIWQKAILDERAKKVETIRCFPRNSSLSPETLEHWLAKLALERLELKLRRFDERLKQLAHERRLSVREWRQPYGALPAEGEHHEIPMLFPDLVQKDFSNKELWEQLLYEGVMEGLGYSKNREPFLRLAKNIPLKKIAELGIPLTSTTIESLMFGAANLLPKSNSLEEKEARQYVRLLKKNWKEYRTHYHGEILHPADWQFFPTRPSNFPTIRLAAASTLIKYFLETDFFRCIIQLMKDKRSAGEKRDKLIAMFTVDTGEFWNRHYSFQTLSSAIVTALGTSRIREIIINTVLPIALLYARIFKDKDVREGVIELYQSIPASDDNAITRLMEHQLLKKRVPLTNVHRQQALIQLYKYYCTEGRCADCELSTALI